MTPREGFKYGFLLRCAEEGLTVEQAEARAARGLEKRAEGWGEVITKPVGDLYTGAKSLATGVPGWAMEYGPKALGLGALGALGVGGLTGYGIAKMQEGDVNPEEIQRDEVISAYRTQAELARRKAIMAAALKSQPRPRSYHGI